MVQARLDALGDDAKRIASAGSVFGESFRKEGVFALLPSDISHTSIDEWLGFLVDREILCARVEGGGTSYEFRHALIRDGAYEFLTADDRVVAHGLAARWLAASGGAPALLVAEHFERSGDKRSAASWFARATEGALGGNDLAAVIQLADRAVACGAEGAELGGLLWLKAEAHQWRAENVPAALASEEACKWLAAGSPIWFRAMGTLVMARSRMGEIPAASEAARMIIQEGSMRTLDVQSIVGIAGAAMDLSPYDAPLADALITLGNTSGRFARETLAHGWLKLAASAFAMSTSFSDAMRLLDAAERSLHIAGDLRAETTAQQSLGLLLLLVGDLGGASRRLERTEATCIQLGLIQMQVEARCWRALFEFWSGNLDVAILGLESSLGDGRNTIGNRGDSACLLSQAHLQLGDVDAASAQAADTLKLAEQHGLSALHSLATLARVALAKSDPRRALALLPPLSAPSRQLCDQWEMFARGVRIEALFAVGEHEVARAELHIAHERLVRFAHEFDNLHLRSCYLTGRPDHALIVRLAVEHGVADGASAT